VGLTTVVGTVTVSVTVEVEHVFGYFVFQPQDVFHSVWSLPPLSTTPAVATAARARMFKRCIIKRYRSLDEYFVKV